MTLQPAIPAETANGPPDWTMIAGEVACPLCAYNLRGLSEPRCPECGYRFEWPDLLDPARRPHPYLFEHHPRRNVRSFVHTYLAALLPRRFWRTLQPVHAINRRRLVAYWVIATSLLVLAPTLVVGVRYAGIINEMRVLRGSQRAYMLRNPNDRYYSQWIKQLGSIEAVLDAHYPLIPRNGLRQAFHRAKFGQASAHLVATVLAWPWLTLATLMIFRASMRRAMVKSGHVLRCTLYSCDWALWLGSLVALLVTPDFVARHLPFFYPLASMPLAAALVFAAYTTYRLGFAYARYLKFDKPFATVAAAQFVVFLVVTVVFVLTWGT